MKKLIAVLSVLTISAHSQTINTIAGGGSSLADGVSATSAKLNTPGGVAFDKTGNFYIADAAHNIVRKVDPSGLITTVAGNGTAGYGGDGGPAINAMLNDPAGLAIDTNGNIYIADLFNLRIRIVSGDGLISTYAGNGVTGYSGDGGPATAARIGNPSGIAIDNTGNVFFTDGGSIREVTGGIISTVAGTGGAGYGGDGGPATDALIAGAEGVAVDAFGNIYIADADNNRIRKVTKSTGIMTTVAGNGTGGFSGDNGPATTAMIQTPFDVLADKFGNIIISDYGNNVVRLVNPSGIISTIAGNNIQGFSGDGGQATAAELYGPYHLFLDSCGNLYICDGHNNRVREVYAPKCDYLDVPNLNNVSNVSVFPNPVFDELFIDGVKTNSWYYLADVCGSVVSSGVLTAGKNNISTAALGPGFYFLEIVGDNSPAVSYKVIKR